MLGTKQLYVRQGVSPEDRVFYIGLADDFDGDVFSVLVADGFCSVQVSRGEPMGFCAYCGVWGGRCICYTRNLLGEEVPTW